MFIESTMDTPHYFRTARELAALIRDGQATAVEIVLSHLQQIRRWNPQLQAVVSVRDDEALREAEQADQARREGRPLGPLHGVPITLKDSLRVRGVRSTFGGLPPYAKHLPTADCKVVARLRQAGAIVIGRTNLPLMALNFQCDNPFYEEGKNPWDLLRTPGGSSGGAAAALAAGFAPLELGSDLGGSIRNPAHCCGVLGLRTTVGLLPIDDIGPEGQVMTMQRLLSLGPMARSLGDLALMLDVLIDASAPRATSKTLAAKQLRIAVTPALPGAEPEPSTAELLDALCAGLRADGHHVEHGAAPEVDLEAAWRVWGIIAGYELWRGVPGLANNPLTRFLFRSYMLRYKLGDGPLSTCFAAGITASRRAYEDALAEQQQMIGAVDAFFERHALWLMPVAMGEAIVRQRRGTAINVGGRAVPYSVYLGAYTVPTTTFETPALTMPIGLSRAGLPIGVQVHGPRFADRQLLDTAERALAKYVTQRVPPLLQVAPASNGS
jgi:amidase